MDLTYEEYVDYLNHFLLQEFTDFDFHDYRDGHLSGSCADALSIL
jgi:hypothetical protein